MRRRGELAIVGAVALGYGVVLGRVLHRIGDEGSIAYGAVRVLNGEVPYRDFFEVLAPGSFLWLAAWFLILGKTWVVMRTALVISWVVSVVALHWLTLQAHDGRFRFIPAAVYLFVAIPMFTGASQHWDSNAAAFLAMSAFVASRGSNSVRRWLLNGVLVGIVALFSQQKGAWLLIGLVAAHLSEGHWTRALRRAARNAAFLTVGSAVVVMGWIAVYLWLGAVGDWYYAVIRWPLERYGNVNAMRYAFALREWVIPWLWDVAHALAHGIMASAVFRVSLLPFLAVVILPAIVLAAVVMLIRRDTANRFTSWTPFAIAGFALFISETHRPDVLHLLYGSPFLWIVAAAVAAEVHGRVASRAVAATAVVLTAGIALVGMINFAQSRPRAVVQSRRGEYAAFDRDEALEFLMAHTSAGDTAFMYPYYPMYYFLADLRNPTRYSTLMYGINTDAQFAEAIRAIDADRTRYVVWDDVVVGEQLSRWFPGYREPPPAEQVMERYFSVHYDVVAHANGFTILERRGR
jgi:hypothetical protein